MIRILFVCHGNICRSTMAQSVLTDMVKKAGLADQILIDSAAVSREEIGNGIYPPALRELRQQGVPYIEHRARQITREDFRRFDRIYYMDGSNARLLARTGGCVSEKLFPLLPGRDVADPWYTGDFRRTFEDIASGCQKILEDLENGS